MIYSSHCILPKELVEMALGCAQTKADNRIIVRNYSCDEMPGQHTWLESSWVHSAARETQTSPQAGCDPPLLAEAPLVPQAARCSALTARFLPVRGDLSCIGCPSERAQSQTGYSRMPSCRIKAHFPTPELQRKAGKGEFGAENLKIREQAIKKKIVFLL